MKPLISIVIATYNRSEMLRGALKSLICQETDGLFSYEIIVIDDGSTDETNTVVDEVAARASVPIRRVNISGGGYTEAMNTGVKEARGRFIAFCDDDELPEPNWLKELFIVVHETGAHVVGGPCILAMSDHELSQLCPTQRAMLGEHMLYKKTQKCYSKRLPGGGNLLVSRHVFDTVGMFDSSILTGGCDRDLVLRVRAMGFDVWYTPRAVVRHIIPPNRLTAQYAKWNSLQCGVSFAYLDWKHSGKIKNILLCVARIGQALLLNLPKLSTAYVRRDRLRILDARMLLWRAIGYTRSTVFYLLPRVFPQHAFFSHANFRCSRKVASS